MLKRILKKLEMPLVIVASLVVLAIFALAMGWAVTESTTYDLPPCADCGYTDVSRGCTDEKFDAGLCGR